MLAFGLKSQLDNTSLEKPLNKIIEARGWVDGKTFVRDVSGWRERVGKTRLTEKGGGTWTWACWCRISMTEPSNGTCPDRIWYRMTPRP